MALKLVTAASQLVTLAEAKRHVHAEDFTDDDEYLTGLILTAEDNVGGEEGWLGRPLGVSTWELRLDEFPAAEIVLPKSPLQSVTSIEYVDVDGAVQEVSGLRTFGVGAARGFGSVLHAFDGAWPETREEPDAVRVTFTAGYTAAPAAIKHGLLLIVGHLYRNRGAVGEKMDVLPYGAEALLMPHRSWAAG